MKILLITQWYKPINAPVKRMVRIAEHLVQMGHKVTVLTGLPSYPTGVLPQKYKWKLWTKEKDNRVEIIRTYEYPTPNKGVFKRLFNNISFTLSASIAAMVLPPYDIVIVSSPSFLSGIPGLLASMRQKTTFIFDIRDLWPDSAVDLKFITKKWLIKLLVKLEKIYYKRADKIFTATPSIAHHLEQENIPKEKIEILINSVDTSLFKPQKVTRETHNFKDDDFIVAYIGNHGPAQNLQTSIKAAEILKKYSKIKFLFVGEGEEKNDLIALSQKLKLKNAIFWPLQPIKKVAEIINITDICNVSLANKKTFQAAMPTKASEYLACGKPVVTSASGSLKQYLTDYQAGFIYRSGDANDLAQIVLKFYKNPKLKLEMGQNARRLALDIFSDKTFYQTLDRIIARKTSS